jgi:hypothetical protein
MNTNVGSTDKIVRVVLALAAFVFAFVTGIGGALGIVLMAVGVVLAATALTGFCPIYRVLGMSTCPVRR